MISKKLIIIILVMVLSLAAQQNVGVLDFNVGSGIAAADAVTITELIRSEVVATGKYTVLERGRMSEVLAEQGFQQSGCTESDCAVQIGKLLNMHGMIYGSLSKFGQTYIMIVSLVDIESGKVINSINEKIPAFDAIPDRAGPIVQKLTGAVPQARVEGSASDIAAIDALIYKNLRKNKLEITKLSKNLSEDQRFSLVKKHKKGFLIASILNFFPGFGIGSFTQRDRFGGFFFLFADILFLGTVGIGASDGSLGLAVTASGTFLLWKIYEVIRPLVYRNRFNRRLSEAMGILIASSDFRIYQRLYAGESERMIRFGWKTEF